MTLSEDLAWRGLIKDKTFDDNAWLDTPKTFYHGVDGSSDSLTVGNLAALVLARRFLDYGWKGILLAGGATSLVGDPGGKHEERQLKPKEEIEHNVEAVKTQIEKLFAGKDAQYVNNIDWFSDINFLDFLRDIGKLYSMTELTQRDYIADRMGEAGSGISYAEFSYTLIQGYDFWHLFKNHQAVLQIGGSDQWGNMLSGLPLIRKKENAEAHVMTMPLVVNKATGEKFGKSEAGAIWLDPSKTTPAEFYQFWINSPDDDVENYLKVFTFLPKEQVENLMTSHRQDPGSRAAQKELAKQVTELVHGSDNIGHAEGVTKYLTSQVSIADASEADLVLLREGLASFKSQPNGSIIEALVSSGLASSNSDARRLLSAGAVYINGAPMSREHFEDSDFVNGRLLLRRGKAYKDSALVELN